MNATVIPISVDTPADSRALKEKLGLSFDLYKDTGGMVATNWGVFDPKSKFNLAATFVVDKGGKVAFRYLGTSKADRPSAQDLLILISRDR